MANSGCDNGSYNHLAGASTGDGDGRRVPPAARDVAVNVQCPDASSQSPNRLHLLCASSYVSCFLNQSGKSQQRHCILCHLGMRNFETTNAVGVGFDLVVAVL